MSLIPHIMVLDDDPRVLDSLVPGFAQDVSRAIGPTATAVKVTAHGYVSDRLAGYRYRPPQSAHLHLVRERGGRFDLARKLLNEQLFAVVASDLRFSDEASGLRAGQLFVEEVGRVHPETQTILYSAYPRPQAFPPDRFVRKGGEPGGKGDDLPSAVARGLARYLATPSVAAFASALDEQGVIYQSESFGTTLAQLFAIARMLGAEPLGGKPPGRGRRPLPSLLIDGESGTGKRALASLFHAATDRRASPLAVASCNELTNETLLRSLLFGHKRGSAADAPDDRPGLVATACRGVILLDDFHRLPSSCTAILHSFLEDGEYGRLGEEEVRRHAEAAAVLTVESGPWRERRRSGELPLAFLARVERLPLHVPPLRERPEDIEAQARWLTRTVSAEVGGEVELSDDAIEGLKAQPFAESNSRELRNAVERAVYRYSREAETLTWAHLRPFLAHAFESATPPAAPAAPANEWQRRLRALAAKTLARGAGLTPEQAEAAATALFDQTMPALWGPTESARGAAGLGLDGPIPWPVWEDLWRCFSVFKLGGPAPAERVLGIPANTLRQWINDREAR